MIASPPAGSSRPFADSVLAYAQAGWPIVPVPPETKTPPPPGFTGADGVDAGPEQLVRWAGSHGASSVAVRMPEGVIGVDVDDYVKGEVIKQGAATLSAKVTAWGPLPATWSSTARGGDQPSRILFFRVPAQRYATVLGPDVEIIQRHHRYAVVWPSMHVTAGAQYQWYDPQGLPSPPPKPGELPDLPHAWVDGLRDGAAGVTDPAAPHADGERMWAAILADDRPACAQLASALLDAKRLIEASTEGTRHDAAEERAWNLVQLAADGHHGLSAGFAELTDVWEQATAGEARGDEWRRLFVTAARKAVTRLRRTAPIDRDPCFESMGLTLVPAPAPGGLPGADPTKPIAPARPWSVREAIGAHLFDPPFHLDQALAQASLERMYPVMRYAYDSHGWLRRGPEYWEDLTDLSEWAISELAGLMPHGDPSADKESEAFAQAARRKRFMSSAPSSGIAKKMRALLAGGTHPCSLAAADLDRDAWLLWAGGLPWDLRASHHEPTLAHLDPATPHVRAAAVVPEVRPTPLWDAFTAAVWPDVELRAWALRVLSVAVTGDPAKVLPILVGEGDRGKTQVVVLIMSVLGSYAHAADPRLLGGADRAHASIVTALKGRRLSFIDEAPRDSSASQERLKQLTGGGELTGNEMGRNPITFTPTHTLVLTANEPPLLTDPAVRRRVRLIPCEGDPAEVIATRAAIGHPAGPAWRREAPGVLAALMREAAGWLADETSARTEAAPEAYRYRAEQIAAEQNVVAAWIDAMCEPHEAGTSSNDLRKAFIGWARDSGFRDGQVPTLTKWGMELTRLGYPAIKRRDGNYRALRIRITSPWGIGGDLAPTSGHVVEGFTATPPQADSPANAGPQAPETISVEGVEGLLPLNTHAHTRAHAQEPCNTPPTLSAPLQAPANPGPPAPQPLHPTPPQPSTPPANPPHATEQPAKPGEPTEPESAKITAKLLAARATAAPAQLQEFTPDLPAPVDITSRIPKDLTPPDPATRPDLTAEFHELKRQQDLRLEAAVRGHLNRPGTTHDSEEVLRYFGEGEFEGDGVEDRLTWTRFLEQRRHEKRYEKAQQKAYDTGRKLGFHHGLHSARPAGHDDEYSRAAHGLDEEPFAHGYQDGVIAAVEVAGELTDLPALVTRDGSVRTVNVDDLPQLADAFQLLDELTVDVEHSGFPLGHADYALRTIQVGNDQVAVVLDADDPPQRDLARTWLQQARVLHAHSATADLVPLAFANVIDDLEHAWARMHDTAIPAKLSDPASTGNDADLKKLAAAVLGPAATSPAADEARAGLFKAGRWLTDIKPLTPPAKSGWAMSDKRATVMVRYAAADVLDDAALAKTLPAVPPAVLDREHTTQRMTARVSYRGLALDAAKIGELLPQQRAALADAAARLNAFGVDNPGSDQQIGARAVQLGAPLPHTKTGRPSVAKGVLDPFKNLDGPLGEFVRARLDYQKAETALGLFLEPWDELVHRGDGRARPTVYTLGADTGRMSCVRPNLQQVPREGGFRACITADPGELIVSADFASVEIRVMAALSGDPTLRQMLLDDVDIHAMIAAQVFGPEWTKGDRYMVKRGVFGWAYGGGIPTLARQVGASESTMASVVDTLAGIAPMYVRWSEDVKTAVKAGHTQFPAYSGRIIHLPGRFPHAAPNYCIQGTARELLVDALVNLADTPWRTATLLPVHDEIVMTVPADRADQAVADLVAAMETNLMGVPIKAEANTPSTYWKDAA